jgi:hypothetical protein
MQFLSGFFLLLSFMLLQTPSGSPEATRGTPGIKMTIQFVAEKMTSEQALYIQADRKRMEYQNSTGGGVHADGTVDMRPGPHFASITRCDLGQTYELNLKDREYTAYAYPPQRFLKMEREALSAADVPPPTRSSSPVARVENTTADTGERKDFFGHVARHVITTVRITRLTASPAGPEETITDGWYIDLDTNISCDMKWLWGRGRTHAHLGAGKIGPGGYEYVDKGNPEKGFAIDEKRTSRSAFTLPDGTKKETEWANETRITEFQEGALDPALFEIPASFRKVESLRTMPPMTLADRWYYTEGWIKATARSLFR